MNPRYRIRGEHGTTVYVGSVGYFAGTEIDWGSWPDPKHLEAVNDAAKRIARYWGIHSSDPFIPSAPFDVKHARFYLPGTPSDPRATRWPGPPAEVTAEMPRYLVRAHEPRFTTRTVKTGETVSFLGWPRLDMQLTPVNVPAAHVAEYFAANSANPAILPSPWNAFDNSLFLPALPSIAKQKIDARSRPGIPFSTPRAPIDYPEGANVVTRALMRSM